MGLASSDGIANKAKPEIPWPPIQLCRHGLQSRPIAASFDEQRFCRHRTLLQDAVAGTERETESESGQSISWFCLLVCYQQTCLTAALLSTYPSWTSSHAVQSSMSLGDIVRWNNAEIRAGGRQFEKVKKVYTKALTFSGHSPVTIHCHPLPSGHLALTQ